jgi:hypothetical protein
MLLTLSQAGGDTVVVDIGGNIGVYTLAAASQGHRVHVFEPVPLHVLMIQQSLRMNALDDLVTLCAYPQILANAALPCFDATHWFAGIQHVLEIRVGRSPWVKISSIKVL